MEGDSKNPTAPASGASTKRMERVEVDEADFKANRTMVQEVVEDMKVMGSGFDEYRQLFTELVDMLDTSHQSEMRLANRLNDILQGIEKHKNDTAREKKEMEELSAEKQRLEEEANNAHEEVAGIQARLVARRKEAAELKASIEKLDSQIEAGSGWTPEQASHKESLEETLSDLNSELASKRAKTGEYRTELRAIANEMKTAEAKQEELEAAVKSIEDEIAAKRYETTKAERKKSARDKEVRSAQETIDALHAEMLSKQAQVKNGETVLADLDGMLKSSKTTMDRLLREYDMLHQTTIRLTDELAAEMHANQQLAKEVVDLVSSVNTQKEELEGIERETAKYEKLTKLTLKKTKAVEEQISKVEDQKAKLKGEMGTVLAEIEQQRKLGEIKKKRISGLVREREILNKSLVSATDKTKHTEDLIKIHTNARKNLENEIAGYRAHVRKQRETIEELQAERKRYHDEAEAANQKYYTALEEVKLQELQAAALQRKIQEGEAKLKQQMNMYEAVRADRNIYSKQLLEAEDEKARMRRKFKIMKHQIDQLKEEITAKDHALVKEHFDHYKVEKEKENLEIEHTRVVKQIQSSRHIISNQASEMQKLLRIIQEADEERQRQQKEYDAVVAERDVLGSQLVRRDDELTQLYEKLKIQKSTLAKGASQFAAVVKESADLTAQVAELQAELMMSKQQVASVDDLRSDVFRLEREVLRERTKVQSLTSELSRPMNVHRWRKLEGSDPKRYEMICRIRSLQQRLIKTTEEVVERELLIQEKEKLFVELKNILARQPGPEVEEQVAKYQQTLKHQAKQMRAIQDELAAYKGRVDEHKHAIEKLNKEMVAQKKDYIMRMKQARYGGGLGDTGAWGATGGSAGGVGAGPDIPVSASAVNDYLHGDLDTLGADVGAAPKLPGYNREATGEMPAPSAEDSAILEHK